MPKINRLLEERYEFNGKTVTPMDLAKTINVSKSTIYRKLKDNSFTIDEAMRIQEYWFPKIAIKKLFR